MLQDLWMSSAVDALYNRCHVFDDSSYIEFTLQALPYIRA